MRDQIVRWNRNGVTTPSCARAQIAQFYEDYRLGKYSKRPDERARLERDILAAGQDGRLVDPPLNHDIVVNTAPSRPRFRYRATA